MLTTLKDIFRPTRKKIIFSAVVGTALTFAGVFATGLARHGPEFVDYVALPFIVPYVVLGWLHLRGLLALITLLVFTFLYWYAIFCFCGYIRSVLRRGG